VRYRICQIIADFPESAMPRPTRFDQGLLVALMIAVVALVWISYRGGAVVTELVKAN
jgi:hypothetical protein